MLSLQRFHATSDIKNIMQGGYSWSPVLFPAIYFAIVAAGIFINFDMSWVRIRDPAFGIRADVTRWTRSLILDFAGRCIARIECLAEEIDAGCFAEGSCFGKLCCAGCNVLCCRRDGDRSASVATYQSGDGVDRENGWGRWTFADLSVLDDV